jgi:hypothetical protein
MLSYFLTEILWQSATPTPITIPVDPGNEPASTAFYYLLFMVLMLGGGVVAFRIRMSFIQKEREQKEAGQTGGKSGLE